MALPAGISTCTVTLGKALGSLFEDATLSGTLTLDRRLVWSATGDTLYAVASPVVASQSGGWLSFVVAHVDQNGFVDQSGSGIKNFSYTFNGRATFSDGSVEPIVKHFQAFVGETTKDLDLLPDGPATLPVVTPVAPVDNAAVAAFVSGSGPTKTALAAAVLDAQKNAVPSTGVRDISSGQAGWPSLPAEMVLVQRVGSNVTVDVDRYSTGGEDPSSSVLTLLSGKYLPVGFRLAGGSGSIGGSTFVVDEGGVPLGITRLIDGGMFTAPKDLSGNGSPLAAVYVGAHFEFATNDPWPTTLPGVALPPT